MIDTLSANDDTRDYFEYEDNATRDLNNDLKIIADYPDPCGRRPVSGISWYLVISEHPET